MQTLSNNSIFSVARRKVPGTGCDLISQQCNDRYDHAYEACSDPPTYSFIKPAPTGAQGLYVVCNGQIDCANALANELPAFAAQGYTQGWQGAAAASLIGYAYPAHDLDGDGLPFGAEIVAKTNPNNAQSDDDGVPGGVEYPFAGVPVSDPCDLGSSCAPPEYVHLNGFETE